MNGSQRLARRLFGRGTRRRVPSPTPAAGPPAPPPPPPDLGPNGSPDTATTEPDGARPDVPDSPATSPDAGTEAPEEVSDEPGPEEVSTDGEAATDQVSTDGAAATDEVSTDGAAATDEVSDEAATDEVSTDGAAAAEEVSGDPATEELSTDGAAAAGEVSGDPAAEEVSDEAAAEAVSGEAAAEDVSGEAPGDVADEPRRDGTSTALVPAASARPAAPAAPPNPLEAMRRFWWLIALLVLIGAGAGVAVGLTRTETHTAEARLNVGRVDVATQSVPGWATASQILADSYSRAIVAGRVIRRVRRRTGVPTERFLSNVTASPIPGSGVVRVLAEADSRPEAMELANESARALVSYVRNLNIANPEAQRLLAQYRAASQAYGRAIAERARLRGDQRDAIIRAEARLQQARLRLGTIEGLYRTSQVGQASPNTLQVLAFAATTTTDRESMLQRLGFAGAVAGLLLGTLLAILLARRRARPRAGAG